MKAGHRIKQLRQRSGLTQKQFGDAVSMKQHVVSQLEKTQKNHIIENWIRMAKFFGMTVEELYCGGGENSPKDISENIA